MRFRSDISRSKYKAGEGELKTGRQRGMEYQAGLGKLSERNWKQAGLEEFSVINKRGVDIRWRTICSVG